MVIMHSCTDYGHLLAYSISTYFSCPLATMNQSPHFKKLEVYSFLFVLLQITNVNFDELIENFKEMIHVSIMF